MRSFHPIRSRRSRIVSASAAVLAAGVVLTGCSASGSSSSDASSITAAEWGGSWDTALQAVTPAFTTKSGVTVNNTVNSGNVVTQLEANPGVYDLAWTIGTTAIQAYTAGDTVAIDTSRIDHWNDLNPTLRAALTVNGAVTAVPISYGVEGILYRKDLVDKPIASWQDLWDSSLKGQISIQDAPSIGGLMVMMAGAQAYGTGITDYDAGFAAMKKLEPNVQYLYTVSSDPINDLASGSLKAAVTFADYGVALEDKNVGIVIPTEGAPWSVQAISIPKDSKKADAVYDFINYMLDDATQQQWADSAAIKPARDDVELSADVQKKVLETKAVADALWPISWSDFATKTKSWTTEWQSIFTK